MSQPPVLSVQEVHKRFADVHAVAGVSFDVQPGEIFGFLGPNGAGKTTTLRMLMGITRPDQGAVSFEGRRDLDRTRVGYLPEERGLYEDATAFETLVYLAKLRRVPAAKASAEATAWLARMGLADRAKHKVNTLSKGNQQKVQFAGAVLHRPALAVLDEPFSGLDPLNQELFSDLIRELRDQGTGVLLSAHQLDLVERLCDRFLLIANGRGILSGTLESIRREAAGGAGEVLSMDVRPNGTAAGRSEFEAAARRVANGAATQVEATSDGALRVEFSLAAGSDLGPIMAELARHARVERVQMRLLRLHEIYVRAVRAAGGTMAAPVAPAPAADAAALEVPRG
jgi:ABC-2 type transport system ATP-binding protein